MYIYYNRHHITWKISNADQTLAFCSEYFVKIHAKPRNNTQRNIAELKWNQIVRRADELFVDILRTKDEPEHLATRHLCGVTNYLRHFETITNKHFHDGQP